MQDISRKAYKAAWYQANKDRLKIKEWNDERRAYKAEWYRRNKNRIRLRGKEKYRENSEKYKAISRINYWLNPEKSHAQNRKWRKRNWKLVQTRNRKIYLEKREEIKARTKAWRILNPERKKESDRRWRSENPEKRRASRRDYCARRRSTVKNSTPDKRIAAWEGTWRRRKTAKCYWCRNQFSTMDCHTDHIIALSNGGAHIIENLCISCGPCNLRKSAKPLARWQQELAEPVLL